MADHILVALLAEDQVIHQLLVAEEENKILLFSLWIFSVFMNNKPSEFNNNYSKIKRQS